ncbi:EamA family transporter [Desulfobacter vibrioformis]|uniref:EamA family transporter n=1 Tax=Desulfobacter vibrioformis TaxID=34031 RepID=UPI00054EE961|nr:EamA family transporter [Desulfobacter vibrioformis]
MDYLYIFGCIFFTCYGQIVLKWRMALHGAMPENHLDKIAWLIKTLFTDPFILSGMGSAFVASLFWMAVVTKFDLSYAYPFMSASFVLVFFLSIILFKEPFSLYKLLGLLFIVMGIVITSRAPY